LNILTTGKDRAREIRARCMPSLKGLSMLMSLTNLFQTDHSEWYKQLQLVLQTINNSCRTWFNGLIDIWWVTNIVLQQSIFPIYLKWTENHMSIFMTKFSFNWLYRIFRSRIKGECFVVFFLYRSWFFLRNFLWFNNVTKLKNWFPISFK
jgi:hypothetical protein